MSALARLGSGDDGYAAVSCLSELEEPGAAATALGIFSIAFSLFIGLPQAYKIYLRKSARGVSFLTLGLGNIGSFLYVLNLTILHYNQIALSVSGDFNFWLKAQRSLTFVWVELLNALSMLLIYPVASYYASEDPVRIRFSPINVDFTIGTRQAAFYGFIIQAAVVTLAWLPAVFTFAIDGRCEPLAGYGNALGLVVAVIIICKFLPQLHASLNAKGSHSLSYVTYGVDAVAGVVAWGQKVFVTHERISTWLPPLFLHVLEVTVLIINYVNDLKNGGFEEGDGGGGGGDSDRHRAYSRVRDTDADVYPSERSSEYEYDGRDPESVPVKRPGPGYGAGGSGDDDGRGDDGLGFL